MGITVFDDCQLVGADFHPDCTAVVDRCIDAFHGLNYLADGRILHAAGNQALEPIAAPAAFWTRPGVHMRYHADRPSIWRHYWVGFRGERVERWIAGGLLPQLVRPVAPVADPLGYERRMARLVGLVRAGDPRRQMERVHLLEELLQAAVEAPGITADSLPGRLASLAATIRRDAAANWHVKDLSADLDCSVHHFRRCFAATLGQPFHAWLLRARIEAAAQALVESSDPVASIAGRFGFSDSSHFIRRFRRHIGTTPARYRAQAGHRPLT